MTREEFEALGLKEGDRVRVKIEGEFTVDHDGDVDLTAEWPDRYLTAHGTSELGDRITIEKVAEPFKPGDVVRSKTPSPGVFWLVGELGYRSIPSGLYTAYGDRAIESFFPTDQYERVTAP